MDVLNPALSSDNRADRRYIPVLMLLFFGSGCSALIYEIVWFHLIQLVIGSSAVSIGVLLSTYMGGMCLGSLLLPFVVPVQRHPLRVYAVIELGIGIMGIVVLFGVPWLYRLYAAGAGSAVSGLWLRAIICAICLLLPTFLMGATLPAVARWIERTPQGISWLGFLYGSNITGAVFGSLLAGFYLLRVYDTAMATYVAATINVGVSVIAFTLSGKVLHRISSEPSLTEFSAFTNGTNRSAYVTIGLSGLCALGAEVTWTRLLSLMLGATVYAFSIILASFLIGLGIGTSIGSAISRRVKPAIALAWCQMLLCVAVAWTAYMLTQSIPYWPIDPSLSKNPWFNFQLDLLRCLWATLPPACLWGASFPLAMAAVIPGGKDMGRQVGGIYAANTLGAIIGAIGFSLLVIPHWGTQTAQRLLIILSLVAALTVYVTDILIKPRTIGQVVRNIIVIIFAMNISIYLVSLVTGAPWGLVAYGRYLPTGEEDEDVIYMGEGMNASIAVTEAAGIRSFHVSGKVVASGEPEDMRLQLMLGHLAALCHDSPRSVLVVGCGAGVTAGSFVLYPDIERIVICEIEPLIPPAAQHFFGDENYHVLDDPRVEIVHDDARHYILTTREKFDIITSDPIHPWVKGAAALYSREYFELCKQHLKKGGVITQWVPLYESNVDAVKSEIATFFEALPYGTIWSNDVEGEGYDLVLLGQRTPTRIPVDNLIERLNRVDYTDVKESLRSININTVFGLLGTYAGCKADLEPWFKDAQINTDHDFRLQYLAGLGLNAYQNESIFDDFIAYRHFPQSIFMATDLQKNLIQQAMQ